MHMMHMMRMMRMNIGMERFMMIIDRCKIPSFMGMMVITMHMGIP